MFEALTLAIGFFGLLGVFFQLKTTKEAIKLDHARRKNQATLEYIRNSHIIWQNARISLEEEFGTTPLTPKQAAHIRSCPAFESQAKNLLDNLEHMAVGLSTGIYDHDLVFRTSGQYLIKMYSRFEEYIKIRREENPHTFIEIQTIVSDFEN